MGGCCSRNDDTASQQGSNGYGSGGGQRLGGSSNAGGGGGQRLGGGGGGGGPRAFTGQGNTLGGGGVDSESGVSAGEAAAMAAMQRENSKQGAGASERDRKMADRRKRDELIGKMLFITNLEAALMRLRCPSNFCLALTTFLIPLKCSRC